MRRYQTGAALPTTCSRALAHVHSPGLPVLPPSHKERLLTLNQHMLAVVLTAVLMVWPCPTTGMR